MWTFLNNLFFRHRITGVYEWRDTDRNSHLLVFTGNKVVELEYGTDNKQLVLTSKQIKNLKQERPLM